MNKTSVVGMALGMVGMLLTGSAAHAAIFCDSDDRTLLIAEDLKSAVVSDEDDSRRVAVQYLHHTGADGQILVLRLEGVDAMNEETVITDIRALDSGKVEGYRARQVGFGVKVIERFECSRVE